MDQHQWRKLCRSLDGQRVRFTRFHFEGTARRSEQEPNRRVVIVSDCGRTLTAKATHVEIVS